MKQCQITLDSFLGLCSGYSQIDCGWAVLPSRTLPRTAVQTPHSDDRVSLPLRHGSWVDAQKFNYCLPTLPCQKLPLTDAENHMPPVCISSISEMTTYSLPCLRAILLLRREMESYPHWAWCSSAEGSVGAVWTPHVRIRKLFHSRCSGFLMTSWLCRLL